MSEETVCIAGDSTQMVEPNLGFELGMLWFAVALLVAGLLLLGTQVAELWNVLKKQKETEVDDLPLEKRTPGT
jgi:hypothetical protein